MDKQAPEYLQSLSPLSHHLDPGLFGRDLELVWSDSNLGNYLKGITSLSSPAVVGSALQT